ncbi:uncharacterized protein LOC125659141 [Ostrea edulis]|uniref:uncharacterized protein LOC125659141 n=1 Tax=Ostrea edulis TaxID=37623 RepID=UPI0024AEA77B|nr:uncharacterized protein LOC125659141 [Ostrea edulis]
MGKDYCAIKGCHNTTGVIGKFGKAVKLHHLPKKQSLRSAWIRAISRSNYKGGHYTYVCSDHFPDGDGRTWKHEVPTLFLPQRTEKTHKQRSTKNSTLGTEMETELEDVGAEAVSEDLVFSTCTLPIVMDHQYSVQSEVGENEVNCEESSTTASTQTETTMRDQSIHVIRPEISVEDIPDDKVQFYTGFPDFDTFKALFETLCEFGMDDMEYDQRMKLRLVDQFLLVMMRLRLGLLVKDLAYRFKLSSSTVSRIFSRWIIFMKQCLSSTVFLPELKHLQQRIPTCFKNFSDTRIVLDCTEVIIQTPSSLENKSLTYSNYKSRNTFKSLIGVSMTGAVCLVSKLWGGSTSDVYITRHCGLLEHIQPGDAVMADKGFIHIKADLEKKGAKLYCPPFKTKNQFTKEEVENTRRIASARIHVERKMEQIKNFRLLQGVNPLSLAPIANEIFFVCAALTNVLPPLVNQ